jgi:hypothetical protein
VSSLAQALQREAAAEDTGSFSGTTLPASGFLPALWLRRSGHPLPQFHALKSGTAGSEPLARFSGLGSGTVAELDRRALGKSPAGYDRLVAKRLITVAAMTDGEARQYAPAAFRQRPPAQARRLCPAK